MKEGDNVKFRKGCRVDRYWLCGNKTYTIQARDAESDKFFDAWRSWGELKGMYQKENYVYLIPDKIPESEKRFKSKVRFCNKKYLKRAK